MILGSEHSQSKVVYKKQKSDSHDAYSDGPANFFFLVNNPVPFIHIIL